MTDCFLHTNHLSVGYSHNQCILHNINLNVQTGEIFCILGANGSGKSTLLRTLAGLLKPLAGNILMNQKNIWSIRGHEKGKLISFVSQQKNCALEFTIEELFRIYTNSRNQNWFNNKNTHQNTNALVKTPSTLLNSMGLECSLQTPFHQLSGGQQQIVRLAMAIIQDCHFLVFDEPTASLDMAHAQIITKQIQDIAKNHKGVILSTHDPQLALNLNATVVLLHNGQMLAHGPALSILNDANLSTLYNTPVVCLNTEHGLWIKPIPSIEQN